MDRKFRHAIQNLKRKLQPLIAVQDDPDALDVQAKLRRIERLRPEMTKAAKVQAIKGYDAQWPGTTDLAVLAAHITIEQTARGQLPALANRLGLRFPTTSRLAQRASHLVRADLHSQILGKFTAKRKKPYWARRQHGRNKAERLIKKD